MPARVVSVISGKGGVGKTTLASALAVFAMSTGARVLVVDLDPTPSMSIDLGYLDRSDDGRGLRDAIVKGKPLRPLKGVRERLDTVPGGSWTAVAIDEMKFKAYSGDTPHYAIDNIIRPLRDLYDFIVIDTPPNDVLTTEIAMTASDYVVLTTKNDEASIRLGLQSAFQRYVAVHDGTNPSLRMLGVVRMPVDLKGTNLIGDSRQLLGELLGDNVKVFDTLLRSTETVSAAHRKLGMTAIEYADHVSSLQQGRFNQLRALRRSDIPKLTPTLIGLAQDFRELCTEILTTLAAYEQSSPSPKARTKSAVRK
jgi:cellulose biosynthesis protein BcsQ